MTRLIITERRFFRHKSSQLELQVCKKSAYSVSHVPISVGRAVFLFIACSWFAPLRWNSNRLSIRGTLCERCYRSEFARRAKHTSSRTSKSFHVDRLAPSSGFAELMRSLRPHHRQTREIFQSSADWKAGADQTRATTTNTSSNYIR
jgi:hypothetical protein